MKYIPYGRQYIDKKDLSNVLSTLHSDYLTTGPLVEKFELAFQKKFKVIVYPLYENWVDLGILSKLKRERKRNKVF